MRVCTALTFGTMRLAALTNKEIVELISHALQGGIRRFHSSNEYETFALFCECLPEACELAGVKIETLEHIVKIATPSFDNDKFDPNELKSKTLEYKKQLGCSKIELLQWMIRHDLSDEFGRLEILKHNNKAIQETVELLKFNNDISRFGCFPYTESFRSEVVKASWCDALVDYYNPIETQATAVMKDLRPDQSIIALRPLYPIIKNLEEPSNKTYKMWHYDNLIRYALSKPAVESLVISMSSKKHVDELIKSVNNFNRVERIS